MNKNILLILFSFVYLTVSAQVEYKYVASKSNIPSKSKFEKRIETNLEQDIITLKDQTNNAKEVAEIFADRAAYIELMSTEEDEYIFNTYLNDYVQNIFNNILDGNPELPRERFELLVSRDLSPNASCFGEGTIVINASLIRRLENESQIAFVLAHEIAHYTEDHVNTSIIEYVDKKNNKDIQKQIKQITKQKYNRNAQGIELLKRVTYNSSKHSRLHETEADAIAFALLANTNYSLEETPKALLLLDDIDEEKYLEEIILHKEFNRQLYPFKPQWEEEENPLAIFFDKDSEIDLLGLDPDSLKTHPDCQKRAALITEKLNDSSVGGKAFVQSEEAFHEAIQQADFDLVLSAYHYKNYGYTIYQSLQLQKLYPDHPFLVGIIGACMGEMAKAINKHELGKVLPQSSPAYEDNYNTLLKFLNNLSIDEMREVGWNYLAIYQDKAAESEALAYGLALTAKLKKKNELSEKYKKMFFEKFPDSYFVKSARKI